MTWWLPALSGRLGLVATDVTTGSEIIGTSALYLGFCALGMVVTRYVARPTYRAMWEADRANRTERFSYWAWGLLATIGVIAFVVGVVAWLTGTTFRTT